MAFTNFAVGVPYTASASDSISGRHRYGWFRWIGATTAGHQCVISDGSGNRIWHSIADGPNFIDLFYVNKGITDLTVTTLGSGTFYAYLL